MFLISNLIASRVNLLQNDYAAGIPSPMAFLGLASVISMRLGMERHQAQVMPILSRVDISPGRTKPAQEAEGKKLKNAEIPEDLHGTVEFSMLIKFPQPTNEVAVAKAMTGLRLAGGVIFSRNHGKPFNVKAVDDDGSALLRAPRGRAVLPALGDDVRRALCFGDPGQAAVMRDLLAQNGSEELRAQGVRRIAVAIGYRLLNTPGDHPVPAGARDEVTPHVFAEPGAGIGELVSVRNPSLSKLDAEAMSARMWGWKNASGHILAHPAYNPEN